MAVPDISNLTACVADSRAAFMDGSSGPRLPSSYAKLLAGLRKARDQRKLPEVYEKRVLRGLIRVVRSAGAAGFAELRENWADHLQAVLQQAGNYRERATDAFQEVVSDVYDGFLGDAADLGVPLSKREVVAPLVKWGLLSDGPYAVGEEADFSVGAGVVGMPTSHATKGLMGWTILGHETAGHDVVGANPEVKKELELRVRRALRGLPARLPTYWADRVEESASDVMGVLNIGPAAAVGLITYFRGWNAAEGLGPSLLASGDADDEHAGEILRGYLVAASVRQLSFVEAKAWADVIFAEVDRDLEGQGITAAGRPVSRSAAIRSATAVAQVIANSELTSLDGWALGDIQNWYDKDEKITEVLRKHVRGRGKLPRGFPEGYYAAHALAAAVTEALAGTGVKQAFRRMTRILDQMQTQSRVWAPRT